MLPPIYFYFKKKKFFKGENRKLKGMFFYIIFSYICRIIDPCQLF